MRQREVKYYLAHKRWHLGSNPRTPTAVSLCSYLFIEQQVCPKYCATWFKKPKNKNMFAFSYQPQ